MRIDPKILYLRVPNANKGHRGDPIGCIASKLIRDHGRTYVKFGVSVVNSREDFSKQEGRDLALERLNSSTMYCPVLNNHHAPPAEPVHFILDLDESNGKVSALQITHSIMQQIIANRTLPSRAYKAAKNWCREFGKRHNKTA